MTDKHPDRLNPESPPGRRHQAEPATRAESRLLALGEVAADNLIRMTTSVGATITDFDADDSLRAAAVALGRDYLAVDLRVVDAPPSHPSDLVVLRWPRPGDHSWLSTVDEMFAAVRAHLSPTGRVAVLLDPTPALAFGITWTGQLVTAATVAGLAPAQDVVCLHSMEADNVAQSGTRAAVALRHRVLLLLGAGGPRHAAD